MVLPYSLTGHLPFLIGGIFEYINDSIDGNSWGTMSGSGKAIASKNKQKITDVIT